MDGLSQLYPCSIELDREIHKRGILPPDRIFYCLHTDIVVVCKKKKFLQRAVKIKTGRGVTLITDCIHIHSDYYTVLHTAHTRIHINVHILLVCS